MVCYIIIRIFSLWYCVKRKVAQKQQALVKRVSHSSLISSEVGTQTATESLYLVLT